jgi:hypothetical protein
MTRQVIISADCHATAPRDTFTDYLDPEWRDEHATWATTVADTPQSSNPHPRIDERVDELRQILSVNAATVFGFDLDQLQPIAERVGFETAELLSAPERPIRDYRVT